MTRHTICTVQYTSHIRLKVGVETDTPISSSNSCSSKCGVALSWQPLRNLYKSALLARSWHSFQQCRRVGQPYSCSSCCLSEDAMASLPWRTGRLDSQASGKGVRGKYAVLVDIYGLQRSHIR